MALRAPLVRSVAISEETSLRQSHPLFSLSRMFDERIFTGKQMGAVGWSVLELLSPLLVPVTLNPLLHLGIICGLWAPSG